ncbi:hypothetical protein QG516_11165 [Pedobacter gandavensis]|uniref:hypothetical protein n=1 Tax=Bacteroidota TaxID=976 RepID=UPI00247B0C6A|nr:MULTISPECIES: hypothetical protein [Bacteroidota]WGQ12196.1 hypothetical protein QG516_11165 [Pedobacter gandavensis]
MKKVLTIFFLSTYLISTTELSQLLRFPLLVEHYFEHKEKNPQISVMEFLVLHYEGNHLENHPHDDDYDQDQKLPFIAHTDFLNFCFVVTPPFSFEIEARPPVNREAKVVLYNDTFSDNNFLSSIWHPPRSC